VVIGAGVGGLICANLLARAGLKTLLIERHYMVGGYCSTFRRAGYTFDAATHFYPLLGNPATITGSLVAELGVGTEWVKMDPVDCFHFPDGSRFAVPADFDTYISKLKNEFPEEAANVDRFFAFCRKAYLTGLVEYFRDVPTNRMNAFRGLSLRDVLQQHFRSEKLRLLLTGDIGHWGSPPSRTSFVFDSMLRLAYFLGNYYPRGGSQAFVDELAQRFEEMGGAILMSSEVRRILVNAGAVCGVEVETGTPRNRVRLQISAGVVVSNADLSQTVEQMLDPESVDADYLAHMRQMRPSHPCFLVHFGLKDISLDQLRQIEGYHWSSWNAEDVATSAFKVFLPTAFDPALAPAGGQIVIIQKLTDISYDTIQDWALHKKNVEDYILASLEQKLAGFAGKIVAKLSASAQTSYRYTLNHHGAMLGWEMSPDQLGEERPGVEAPVKNLYCVGHWVRPGGGITPVMISALQAARLITGASVLRTSLRSAHAKVATEELPA
jgi:phytoene dehydrogenase-like protein